MTTDLTAAIEAAAYDAADRTIDAIEQRKDFVFNGMFDPEVREIALAVLAAVEPLIAERAAADERERWRTLLADHVDPDPCWFDHHGGCQAHGYLSLQPGEKCPSAQAKELLAETEAAIARRPETA